MSTLDDATAHALAERGGERPPSPLGVLEPHAALRTDLVGARDREVAFRTESTVAGRVAHTRASARPPHNSDGGRAPHNSTPRSAYRFRSAAQ